MASAKERIEYQPGTVDIRIGDIPRQEDTHSRMPSRSEDRVAAFGNAHVRGFLEAARFELQAAGQSTRVDVLGGEAVLGCAVLDEWTLVAVHPAEYVTEADEPAIDSPTLAVQLLRGAGHRGRVKPAAEQDANRVHAAQARPHNLEEERSQVLSIIIVGTIANLGRGLQLPIA